MMGGINKQWAPCVVLRGLSARRRYHLGTICGSATASCSNNCNELKNEQNTHTHKHKGARFEIILLPFKGQRLRPGLNGFTKNKFMKKIRG